MKCPKCQSENREEAKFCEQCGARMELECPNCKARMGPGKNFCGDCGHPLVSVSPPPDHSYPSSILPEPAPSTEGERKHVTVLFSDLSGYTSLSEKLDPEELKELTGTLFARIAKVIEKYGGFVEKYVGDAVMAVFGVPFAHEDDPVRAIRAAREIHQVVADRKSGFPLSMHTGVNTGLVVTGVLDEQKGTHGIAGDTVNVAARLCGLARPEEVVVGSETWRQAEGYFDFEELPPVAVKGKTGQLRVFRVLSPKEKPLTVHRLSGIRARLTGRDAEMAELRDVAERFASGKGTIVSILGDAGTGKSRLIEEFKKTHDLSRTRWFESHAYPYAQNTPYSLVTDLLSRVFEIEEGDAPNTVREKLEKRIRSLTGNGANIVPYVASLYSLRYPELQEITPDRWKLLLQRAVNETLAGLARHSPTVIVTDDLQWADPSSLELLRSFLMDVRLPSPFLLAYRPEFSLFTGDQAVALGEIYHEIRLQDLSSSESLQMLRSLLDTTEVPSELQRFFRERVQGNPFYLEEVVNGLIDSGTLTREGGTWKLTKALNEAEISSGIHGVIEARLDRLEKETKLVLQEASVIGRSFLFEILRRITTLTEQCERSVARLERLDFIRTKALDPELEYVFKHALTQEVVYNGLLKKDRREIHERIARVMEGLFQDRLPEFYEILAYHYREGLSSLKAVEYLTKSGQKSLERYAVAEAYHYYEQAYQIVSQKAERTQEDSEALVGIVTNWAYALYYQGDFKRLLQLLTTHEKEAASLGNDARSVMFHTWLGWAHFFTGKVGIAYDRLVRVRDMAEELGDRKGLGYALTWLAYTAATMGKFEEALDAGKKAVDIGKSFPSDQYLSFKGLFGIATAYCTLGDLRSALAYGQALLDHGRRYSNQRSLVLGYVCMAWVYSLKGDPRSCAECCQKAIDEARDPFYVLFGKPMLGGCYLVADRLQEAEKELREVIDFDERFGIFWMAALAHLFFAMLRIARGQISEGVRAIEELSDRCYAEGHMYGYLTAEQLLGEVYLKMIEGQGPRSLSFLARNVPFLIKNIPFADRKAQEHLVEVIRVSEKIGRNAGQAYLDLGLLHKAKKRKDKARESLSEAVRLLRECEADGFLGQAMEALESLGEPAGAARKT